MVPSMGRRGHCHDNAVAESFFSALKKERIKRRIYPNRATAARDVSITSRCSTTRFAGMIPPVTCHLWSCGATR